VSAKPAQANGLLILDKPSGPTSTDCLNRLKRELGQKKIGHAGTLDPLASGVLLVLLGQGTKLASFLTSGAKTYRGRLQLGVTTDTFDIAGEVTARAPLTASAEEVRAAILTWEGRSQQEVPAYSAAKHQGRPLYALARAGLETPVKTKDVSVSGVEVLDLALPEVEFRVTVSAGTYIRSLVHSLGKRLGCGAVLTGLVREASHPFTLAQAHGIEAVLADPAGFPARVLGLTEALAHWPKAELSAEEARLVQNGVRLPDQWQTAPGARALFLAPEGRPLALAEAVDEHGRVVWSILRGLWDAPHA